jgi:hypothetical protein
MQSLLRSLSSAVEKDEPVKIPVEPMVDATVDIVERES